MGLITGSQSHLTHPSNRLYSGECSDFRDAVKTYIAAMEHEERLFTDEDEFNRESKALFAKSIESARWLLKDYEKRIGEAEHALAKEWSECGDDETIRMFGAAMLSGDYSPLAV